MVSVRLMGGIGNQLFQMCFLYAYAKKHELEYCIPTQVVNPHIVGKEAYYFSGLNYSHNIPNLPIYREKHFHYEEIPKMDNVCFEGYFQSFRYLDECRDDILKVLGFNWQMNKGTVSVHIRRTDFLKWPNHHPPVSEKYLRNAIMEMYNAHGGKVKFKFFSDDIDFCKEFGSKTFELYDKMVEYSEGKDEVADMQEASCCEDNIGSNSSFSLWIYFLNKNPDKLAIFPRRWFGPELQNETKDIYPEKSLVL